MAINKNKVQLQETTLDSNGHPLSSTDVNPLTSSDCVIMENGMTLEDVMGNDTVATPTIMNEDTSFKAGIGDSETKVIDSDVAKMVIEGKTYQNILPRPTTLIMNTDEKEFKINDKIDNNIVLDDNVAEIATVKGQTYVNVVQEESASEYVAIGEELNGQSITTTGKPEGCVKNTTLEGLTLVNVIQEPSETEVTLTDEGLIYPTIIKPSTTYTVQLKQTTVNSEFPLTINLGGTTMAVPSTKFTIATPSALTSQDVIFTGKNNVIGEVVITEGDTTGIEYDYFEGMNDVKSPKMIAAGKNLFDYSSHPITLEKLAYTDGQQVYWTGYIGVKTYVPVKENTTYTYSNDINVGIHYGLVFYDGDKSVLSYINIFETNNSFTSFTTPKGCKFIRFAMETQTIPQWIQLEEGTTATSYEPYKGVTIEQSIDSIPLTSSMFEQGYYDYNKIIKGMSLQQLTKQDSDIRLHSKSLIPVKPNTIYKLSDNSVYIWALPFDKNGGILGGKIGTVSNTLISNFTTDANTHYIAPVIFITNSDFSLGCPDLSSLNLTLQEVTDEIVLRSIGDVKDTLNLTTGEYVQRIGETVLDGSDDENWILFKEDGRDYSEWSTYQWRYKLPILAMSFDIDNRMKNSACDKLKFGKIGSGVNEDYEHYRSLGANSSGCSEYMYIWLEQSKASTIDGLKQYLQSNPITIQYVLATPIIHKVNLTNTTKLPSYTSTTHYDTIVPSNSLVPNIKIPSTIDYNVAIKPSTEYTIRANTTNALSVNLGGSTGTLANGKVTLTTPSTLAHNSLKLGNGKAKEVMVIEGSEIKDNVPFFNGMKNVQMGGIKLVNIARGATVNGLVTANTNKTQFTYTANGSGIWGDIKFDKTLLKTKTVYTVCVEIISNTSDNSMKVQLGHGDFGILNIPAGYIGRINKTILSPSAIPNDFGFFFRNGSTSGQQVVISNPMIIEGDWTHLDEIPYIESEMIIEQPIIRSQGKNLSDGKLESGRYAQNVGVPFSDNTAVRTVNKIKVKPSTVYTLKIEDGTNLYNTSEYCNGVYIGFKTASNSLTFTTSPTTNELHLSFKTDNINLQYQIEESSTATSYEPFKHQTLYSNRVIGYEEDCYYAHGGGVKVPTDTINSVMADVEGLSVAYVTGGSSNYTFWDKDNVFISGKQYLDTSLSSYDKNGFITVPSNAKYLRFAAGNDKNAQNLYKTTTVTGELPLRSLPSGVCDSFNLVTGEYVQRVGEVVLDGVNIKPKWIVQDVSNDVTLYFDFDSNFVGAKNASYALSDKFNYENHLYNDDRTRYTEGICIGNNGWGSIRIFNSRLETADYNGFVKWLQQNPVTVQYELATPIVRKIGLTAKGNYKEIELNGSERVGQNHELSKKFHVYDLNLANDGQQFTLFTNKEQFTVTNSAANYTVYKYKNGEDLVMIINENINTVDLFKRWLSQNPMKVSYLTTNSSSLYSNIQKPIFFNDVKVQFMNDNVDIQPTLTLQSSSKNSYVMDMMKANTKYTLKALRNPNPFTIDGTSYNATTNGTFTSPSTLTNKLMITGQDVQELMIIEGDVTGKQLPYYKGIRSSFDNTDKVEVFVRNKNLVKELYPMLNNDTCVIENGVITIKGNGDGSGELNCVFNPSIYLEKDKTYTFSFSSDAQFGKTNGTDTVEAFLLKDGGTGYYIETYGFTRVFTCGATGYYNIRLDINKNNTTHKFYNIQIEESPTATPYQPYKENSTIINMSTRWETVKVVKPVSEDGALEQSNGSNCVGANIGEQRFDYIPVQPNDWVLIYNNSDFRAMNCYLYDINKNFIQYTYTTGRGLTIPKDCYFIRGFSSKANTSNLSIKIQRENPIALNELPNGVKDELIINRATSSAKLIRRVGKVVLDGSEDWRNLTEHNNNFRVSLLINNMKYEDGGNSGSTTYIINDKLPTIKWGGSWNTTYDAISCDTKNIHIHLANKHYATINLFKGYLKQNPITVYYELEQPIITEIRLKGYPFVYEDGSITLNTDIAPVTRTSYNVNQHQLINSQNETIIRHDKQISDLYDYIEIYLDEIYRMELFKMQLELSL